MYWGCTLCCLLGDLLLFDGNRAEKQDVVYIEVVWSTSSKVLDVNNQGAESCTGVFEGV